VCIVLALAAGCAPGRPTDEDLRRHFARDRDAFEIVRDAMLVEPRFGLTIKRNRADAETYAHLARLDEERARTYVAAQLRLAPVEITLVADCATFWIWRGRHESRGIASSRAPVDVVADTERAAPLEHAYARLADEWYIVDAAP
jgi:hypothetical protein